MKNLKENKWQFIIIISCICVIVISGIIYVLIKKDINTVSYNEFIEMVELGEVSKVEIDTKADKFDFTNKENKMYKTDNPESKEFKKFLLENNIEVETKNSDNYVEITFSIIRTVSIITLFLMLIKQMDVKALNKKDSLVATVPNVKFDNIAGNEEVKEDMRFLVNFLKKPDTYHAIGAKLPKGVALYGPPGTGKTLTAKAIAGEAEVPFFSINGSDFIEMYAGLGAKRVRDLYNDAKAKAPCIVFIDEIDAIGTNRGGHNSGEKDQTINALLAELDGFNTNSPIVTIIATNRIKDLDPALIRPGRIDKHIAINLPDKKDRLEILKVHSKNKKLSENINMEEIANMTIGFSGASLEALMNESAIIAVNENCDYIENTHINDAYYKMIIGGHKKKNNQRDINELKLIAYHEAGHALTTKLLTDNNVPKVTIIPSTTGLGGATLSIPKRTTLMTKDEILNNIKVLYAGRAAELIITNDNGKVTTGAAQDIEQATDYINKYFADYGMSEQFGLLKIKDEKTYRKDAIELSKKMYDEVVSLLQDNKVYLDNIANVLITNETMNEKELDDILDSYM